MFLGKLLKKVGIGGSEPAAKISAEQKAIISSFNNNLNLLDTLTPEKDR